MAQFLTRLFCENGFVKILAAVLIFYFAIYKYDKSPDSVAKRFNKEELTEDFKDIKKQTKKIFDVMAYKNAIASSTKKENFQDVETASSVQRKLILTDHIAQIDSLDAKLLNKIEVEGQKVECGDFVTFSYNIFQNKNSDILFNKSSRSLTISQQESIFFERLLVGLKKGEEREVFVDRDYNFLPSIVRKYFLSSEGRGIFIKLKLDDLEKSQIETGKMFSEIEKIICN